MAAKPEAFDPYHQWLGISAAARPIHHYTLLGLTLFEADANKIAAAADERMRHVRQFQSGPRGMYTQRLLNELATARICLLSPTSKSLYDQQLQQILFPPTVPANAAAPRPKRRLQEMMPPAWDGFAGEPQASESSTDAPDSADGHAERTAPKSKAAQRDRQTVIGLGLLILLVAVLGGVFLWRMTLPEPQVVSKPANRELSPEVDEASPDPTDSPKPKPKTPTPPKPTTEPATAEPPSDAIVVLQEGSGELNLTPATALVEGDLEREVIGTNDALVKWSGPDDAAEWQFKLVKPGFFELELQYVSHPSLAGKLVKVDWGGETKSFRLRAPQGGATTIRDSHIIVIKRSGLHTLIVRPAEVWPENTLQLVSVRLIPATGP
jgi:hypothetical protein